MIPSSASTAHVAVLGAGCAGLSLAVRLIERFPHVTVTVVDPRTRFTHDRTWCFWQLDPARDDRCVTHRWTNMLVRGGGRTTTLDCAATPYCHVPSDVFFESALARLRGDRRCTLHLGVTAGAVQETSEGVEVVIHADGEHESLHVDHVFDGRPAAPENVRPRPALVQHFLGQELAFDADVFDPAQATLMDFDVDQRDGLHFMYVLPFGTRRALIESTFMTPAPFTEPDYAAHIQRYCHDVLGAEPVRTVREERGRLPMDAARRAPRSTRRIWPIGTRAGVARPATGYAFDAIQRDSDRVCAAFAAGTARPAPPRPAVLDRLDGMLLSLLAAQPERGPEIFGRLFADAPGDAVIRFLSDRPRMSDILRVVLAVPKGAMIGHLARTPGALA